MIQGIQGLQKFIGINPAEAPQKPQAQSPKEKGFDIGALLAGKDKVLKRADSVAQLGKENEKKLDIKV